MKTTTIKRNGQLIVQVRCKDYQAVKQALKTFGRFIKSIDGIKQEKFLYFAM